MSAIYEASESNSSVLKEYARINRLRDGDTWYSYELGAWVSMMSARFEKETGWNAAAKPSEWVRWLQKQEVPHA